MWIILISVAVTILLHVAYYHGFSNGKGLPLENIHDGEYVVQIIDSDQFRVRLLVMNQKSGQPRMSTSAKFYELSRELFATNPKKGATRLIVKTIGGAQIKQLEISS